jgi:hypothetical protein
MSDIDRTRMIPLHIADQAVAACDAEIAKLREEVERLKKFNDEALAHIAKEERKSRERLEMEQAQVERLTKAGDTIIQILCKYVPPTGAKYALMDWRDAKEGKPRA